MNLSAVRSASLPHVDAVLNYLAPMKEKPCWFAGALEQGLPQTNVRYERRRVQVHDARSVADALSLDEEGVQLVQHKSAALSFHDEREVARVYYPEVERLVADAVGACW